MQNYDFQILQPNEFEHLVRDLLQMKESVFVESFTLGRDDGIDLRYATCKGSTVIVQAKRYSSYASLKSELKKRGWKNTETYTFKIHFSNISWSDPCQ